MKAPRLTSLALLLLVFDALALSGVTAILRIYENRHGISGGRPFFETWAVDGVATIEIGGTGTTINFSFDCNTTTGDGETITWDRQQGSHSFAVLDIHQGKRLSMESVSYTDLDVYVCTDPDTGDQISINVTISNPAVCPVDNTVGVVEGGAAELAAYVSGIPPILSQDIHWYNPSGVEITTGATFQNSRRRMILTNVPASSAGMYRCEARLSDLFPPPSTSAYIHLEVYVPSVVTKHPSNSSMAEEWTSASLTCTATGNPLPTFTWEREGGDPPSTRAEYTRSVSGSTATSTLTIEPVWYADAGRYRCVAKNPNTAAASSEYGEIVVTPALQLEVTINGADQPFSDLIAVQPGSRLNVECGGSGNLEWRSSPDGTNLQPISTDNSNPVYQYSDPTRNVQGLQMDSFTEDLTSTYVCTTDLTFTQLQESILITSSNPAVFISGETQYLLAGMSTDIEASIYANPAPDEVQWLHEGVPVDPASEPLYSILNGGGTLHIEAIDGALFGHYEVVVRVRNQTASDSITLAIPAHPTAVVTPSELAVNIGDRVTFHCEAGGDGELTVDWRQANGEQLPSEAALEGNTLVISSADASLAGTYICTVSNLAGEVEAAAELNVFFRPTATINYGEIATTTSNPTLCLDFTDGDEGPRFSCSATGYFPPPLTWTFKGGVALPADVEATNVQGEGGMVRELVWKRQLDYSDSGQYKCTAVNNNGTSSATLNITVFRDPKINSVFLTDPVVSMGSSTYAIPGSYIGVALTCTALAWPKPTIRWVRVGGEELPDGVVSEGSADSATDTSTTVSARLRWNRGFTDADEGQYTCVVSWDNYDNLDKSDSRTVEILRTTDVLSSPTPKPVCTISSPTVAFQLRVLTEGCDAWDTQLYEHIRSDFSEELRSILISSCNCTVAPAAIQINSLACSQAREGAVVFEGLIETDVVSQTEQIYCSLLSWQESSPEVLVSNELYTVDATCQLPLDADSDEECVAARTESDDLDIRIIIYIVAPVALAIAVLAVVICCLCCFSKKMRSKRDLNNRETWPSDHTEVPKTQPVLQRVYRNPSPTSYDTEHTGSSPVVPARTQQLRTSPSVENTLVFTESPYQQPHRPHSNSSPEHNIPMRTLSQDRLIESTDSGSPTAANPGRGSLTTSQLDAQPYQQPVSSVGSIDRLGLQHPVQRPAGPPVAGVANPLSFLESDEFRRRPSQESASSMRRHPHDYQEGAVPSLPRRQSPPTSATLPPGTGTKRYVNLPVLDERTNSPGPPTSQHRSHRGATHADGTGSSYSSIVKLAPAPFSPSRESGMSEDLPPYSSRPPSLQNIRPWYEAESDFSIDRSSRRSGYAPSDVQPYATIHNSAIPLGSSSSVASRPQLPPSRPPTAASMAVPLSTDSRRPQPYATPIRGSVDTLSNAQGSSRFQMVTV